jgi:hypothetical protein
MANTSNSSEKTRIAGRNIYVDRKNRHILYDKRTETGYIIREKDQGKFSLFHNRISISLAAGLLVGILLEDWKFPLALGLGLFLLLEVLYRRRWLPSLPRIEHYKPDQPFRLQTALVQEGQKGRCLLLFFLYLAMGILFVINEYSMQASLPLLIAAWALLAGCLYMAVQYLRAFLTISRQKK